MLRWRCPAWLPGHGQTVCPSTSCGRTWPCRPLLLPGGGWGGEAQSVVKCDMRHFFSSSTILWPGNKDSFWVTVLQGVLQRVCVCVCVYPCVVLRQCVVGCCSFPKWLNAPMFVEHPWNQSVFGVIIVNCADYSINSSN